MKLFTNIKDPELLTFLEKLIFKTDPQVIGDEKISLHMGLTLDNNTVHLDPELARNSSFGKPVVHGPLQSSLSTGWIHHIFRCKEYTYPIQRYQYVDNLYPMAIGESIHYEFSTDVVSLREQDGKNPYLKVIYDIKGYVKGNVVVSIKWYIRYETSRFLLKNKSEG